MKDHSAVCVDAGAGAASIRPAGYNAVTGKATMRAPLN
jgi:hypothetical protein